MHDRTAFRVGPWIVAVVMLAGGVATGASNMGFKIVRSITFGGAGQIGDNWTSIPYRNPYGNANAFCLQTGLTSTGVLRATILRIDPVTGASTVVSCGTSGAEAMILNPGQGIRIRQPDVAGAPTSILIAGSHDANVSITIPDAGAGNIGSAWVSIPYHTLAENANDFCLQSGLTSTGLLRATIVSVNPVTGASTSVSCGTSGASALILQAGVSIRVREPNGPLTFVPLHY
jgi:hypothetical protein